MSVLVFVFGLIPIGPLAPILLAARTAMVFVTSLSYLYIAPKPNDFGFRFKAGVISEIEMI